jgi:hypothetical protein
MLAGMACGWAVTAQAVQQQQPPVPAGTWKGLLQGAGLNVVFHITAAADGKFTATMDSPDQNVTGIPVSQVTYADSVLKIVVAAIQGDFEGRLGADGKFKGQWRQGTATLPLVLEKSAPPARKPDGAAELE